MQTWEEAPVQVEAPENGFERGHQCFVAIRRRLGMLLPRIGQLRLLQIRVPECFLSLELLQLWL